MRRRPCSEITPRFCRSVKALQTVSAEIPKMSAISYREMGSARPLHVPAERRR